MAVSSKRRTHTIRMLERTKVNNNIKNGEEPSTGGLSEDIHDVPVEWSTDPWPPKARSASVLPKRIK
jgi:hypothetical protein